jgi:hypothetical protein
MFSPNKRTFHFKNHKYIFFPLGHVGVKAKTPARIKKSDPEQNIPDSDAQQLHN